LTSFGNLIHFLFGFLLLHLKNKQF
jgi:hypothetical protein